MILTTRKLLKGREYHFHSKSDQTEADGIIIQLPRERQHLDGEELGDAPRRELLHDPRRDPQPRDLQPLLSPRIHAHAFPRSGPGPRRGGGPEPQGVRRAVERPPRRRRRPWRGRLAWAGRCRWRREERGEEGPPAGGGRRRGECAAEQGDHRGGGGQWELVVELKPRRRGDLEGRGRDFSRLPFCRGPGFTERPGQNRPNHFFLLIGPTYCEARLFFFLLFCLGNLQHQQQSKLDIE